jgi:L-cysteine:1D-myo-inositol 2-amino-2-deoxy-alpha-D-glucopyranoside ligase
MIRIIEALIKKGFAYEKDGNVYFEVRKFKKYGELAKFNYKQMILISKERGGNPEDPLKKHPLDFVLWQKSKSGEPSWESPWGKGRPGWHIECSALIHKYLGDQIDIHGGGLDLIFPHHESEIAQSEIYTGKKPFVSLWMHTKMVLYMGKKMSKSLGNLVMISDLRKKFSVDAIRFVLLSHHYRESFEFEEKELYEAEVSLAMLKNVQDDSLELPKFINFMDNDLHANLVLKNLKSRTVMKILGFT